MRTWGRVATKARTGIEIPLLHNGFGGDILAIGLILMGRDRSDQRW
jgi:hypothetical protein